MTARTLQKPDNQPMPRGQQIEVPSPEADALVELAIGGDSDAFASLFRITMPSVYRYLYGRCGDASLAEDLAQDSYVRAMRAIQSSFQGGSSDFLAWMIRIARNRFLDHVKSGRVRWEVVVDDIPVTVATGNPETEALASVEGADLRKALSRLTDEQQEIVMMRFFQGLQIAEVAGATGRTEGAVKALQFRALRALARILQLEGADGAAE
ncbi:MAG TPA: sigma-70 family RNA polymerase sigma factor [Actinomycetota bacterium]|nr:sigma-70 family RNA polymerase sigma factor [Actinomycetota bacterium]